MRALLTMVFMSAPVQALLREVATIIAAQIAVLVTTTVAALSADIQKRLENRGESNVQLHNQNIRSKKSQLKNRGLRIVSN